MTGKIFINYRRGDDPGFTQALYQRLEDEFADADLFMDVEGHIKPGDDFVEVLGAKVADCDVLLVVMGPRWADILSKRVGEDDDFVVIEIEAALKQGKRVIPVLVGGAGMPRADDMPDAIRTLARRNAVGLRPERFKADCQGLVTALKESLAAAEQERQARTSAERKAVEASRRQEEAEAAARAKATEDLGRAQAAAGLSSQEIRKAEELANWDFVKDRNSVQDLRDHLARFPGGTTARYAITRIEGLAWSALSASPAVEQLTAFLNEFPNGEHAKAAQAQIAALKRKAMAQRAEEQSQTRETAEWGGIAAGTDKAALRAFLLKWPEGQHAKDAEARLKELNQATIGGVPAPAAFAIAWAILLVPVSFGIGAGFANGPGMHLWGTGPGNTGATLGIALFAFGGAAALWKRRGRLVMAEKLAYALGFLLAVVFFPIFYVIK